MKFPNRLAAVGVVAATAACATAPAIPTHEHFYDPGTTICNDALQRLRLLEHSTNRALLAAGSTDDPNSLYEEGDLACNKFDSARERDIILSRISHLELDASVACSSYVGEELRAMTQRIRNALADLDPTCAFRSGNPSNR